MFFKCSDGFRELNVKQDGRKYYITSDDGEPIKLKDGMAAAMEYSGIEGAKSVMIEMPGEPAIEVKELNSQKFYRGGSLIEAPHGTAYTVSAESQGGK